MSVRTRRCSCKASIESGLLSERRGGLRKGLCDRRGLKGDRRSIGRQHRWSPAAKLGHTRRCRISSASSRCHGQAACYLTQEKLNVARLVTPQRTEAGAQVVNTAGWRRPPLNIRRSTDGSKRNPLLGRFVDHPTKWHVREAVVGIAAPNVGVRAGEPDLPQPVRPDSPLSSEALFFRFTKPMESDKRFCARRPNSGRVGRAAHFGQQQIVAEFHWPNPFVGRQRKLVHG